MADIPTSLPDDDARHVEELLDSKEFDSINETQEHFLKQGGMDPGNTLLCAETGNGKTFCAEAAVTKALSNGKSVAYLVPSVSLTNGKYESLAEWVSQDYRLENATWGNKAGYQQADVIVATFDSFYEAAIRGVGLGIDTLIFDDFHELYSGFRGDTIEKCLTIAKQTGAEIHANSATVGNPDEIARWLDADLIISPAERGVPITEIPVEKGGSRTSYGEFVGDLIMENRGRGPFMVFNFSTSHTQTRALQIKDRCSFESPETDYASKVRSAVDTVLTSTHENLIDCLENGVAFHYAGLESGVKEIVEDGVKDGEIKCVSCTTTLAYGFDSPIQSVIVADLSRFGEFIGKYEYIQWIGRAGRGGDMDEAFAYPIYTNEEADDYFEFETPVEEKSLEAIGSHFGEVPASYPAHEYTSNAKEAKSNLEWLLIELVVSGWNTLDEIIEFVSLTLYGFYNTDGVSNGVTTLDANPVAERVQSVLEGLDSEGFIHYTSENQITATELGNAVFEYDHSTRIEATPVELKSVVETLEGNHPVSPEQLVRQFASISYQCDLGESPDEGNQLWDLLAKHDLGDYDSSVTAGIMTWLWCGGVPVDAINNALGTEVSHISSTADNLAGAIREVSKLYAATPHGTPEWVSVFAQQLAEGVTVEDLHLTSYSQIARGRVMALEERTQDAWGDLPADDPPADDSPTIEKLAFQLERSGEDFESYVFRTDHIGSKTVPTVVEAVEDWVEGDYTERTKPPVAESGRELLSLGMGTAGGSDAATTSTTTGSQQSGSSGTTDSTEGTSLDDFL